MLDNDKEEEEVTGFIGEELDYLIFLKTRDKPGHRQAILKACNYFPIMHVLHSKSFQNKNLFMCGYIITTIVFRDISSTTTNMAYSQHYLVMYQAHTTTAKSHPLYLSL